MLMNWRHSGFNVFCGSRIQPGDEKAMENLARYVIRASFSQERMTYFTGPNHPSLYPLIKLIQYSSMPFRASVAYINPIICF